MKISASNVKIVGKTLPKIKIVGNTLSEVNIVSNAQSAPASELVFVKQSWHEVWMGIARHIAQTRSTDTRLKVGAIVVPEDNTGIIALGYNGGPRGLYDVPLSNEPGKSGFVHAEANCLIKCPYHYPTKKFMYVTHSPCIECARLIVNAGISRVVYGELYRDSSPLELLRSARIETYSVEDAILIAEVR